MEADKQLDLYTCCLSFINTLQGYYTTGMRCEYETSYSYLEATVLRKSGSNVYCYCDVTYPGSSHNALSTSLTATCTLIVSRCRLEQNILN